MKKVKKVINTFGYGTTSGQALQITLPNGKYYYTGVFSAMHIRAEKLGMECKIVEYFGACICSNINELAHKKNPIQIGEKNVKDFINKIATDEEVKKYL